MRPAHRDFGERHELGGPRLKEFLGFGKRLNILAFESSAQDVFHVPHRLPLHAALGLFDGALQALGDMRKSGIAVHAPAGYLPIDEVDGPLNQGLEIGAGQHRMIDELLDLRAQFVLGCLLGFLEIAAHSQNVIGLRIGRLIVDAHALDGGLPQSLLLACSLPGRLTLYRPLHGLVAILALQL